MQQYVRQHSTATSSSAMSAASSGCCLTLQAWARMEAGERHLSTARKLFQHALDVAAAEGAEGDGAQGRGEREAGRVSACSLRLTVCAQ